MAAEAMEGAEAGVVAGIPDRGASFNFLSKTFSICALIDWALRSFRRYSSSLCPNAFHSIKYILTVDVGKADVHYLSVHKLGPFLFQGINPNIPVLRRFSQPHSPW